MRIEIWSDVVCPFCYIGHARLRTALATFAHREDVEVIYRSFELDPGQATTEPLAVALGERYGARAARMEEQVAAVARGERLAYRTDRLTGPTVDAHRLLHLARERGRQDELLQALFKANFAEARNIFTVDVLLELAVRAGLDKAEARRVLSDPVAYLDAVRADEKEASRLGVSGVPFFLFDGRYAVSGAQSVEAFTGALRTEWDARHTGDICEPDGTCGVQPSGGPQS
jgi:predicted DsbA family dithiol-disulfide isomerase